MSQTKFFGFQVGDVMFAGFSPQRYLFNNFYTVNFEAFYFFGVVREYANFPDAEVAADLRRYRNRVCRR